jgi:hypothetical protein
MRRNSLAVLVCLVFAQFSPMTWAEGDHPLQDAWNRALKRGAEKAQEMENLGRPRVVKKGAKPEIIIKGETITIDGKTVAVGGTLDSWKNALPGTPSCEVGNPRKKLAATICYWHHAGIELLTFHSNFDAVKQVSIYLNLESFEASDHVITYPDGTKVMPKGRFQPDHAFPGYLEIDGYGIDSKTEFWEVSRSVDPQRNLHCGTLDCSHPGGYFSDLASLYLRLNNTSERGNIYEISISGSEPYEAPPAKK